MLFKVFSFLKETSDPAEVLKHTNSKKPSSSKKSSSSKSKTHSKGHSKGHSSGPVARETSRRMESDSTMPELTIAQEIVLKTPATKTVGFCTKKLPETYQGRGWSVHDKIPYKPIDCEDVSYKHTANVIELWNHIRRIPNYEAELGTTLFLKMFELEPCLSENFGFAKDVNWSDPASYNSRRFTAQAIIFFKALDKAVDFLGPDLEPLELELQELGRRHIYMGSKPEHWPIVGEALIHTFKVHVGEEKFDSKIGRSWNIIYNFLAFYMIRGLLLELSERS